MLKVLKIAIFFLVFIQTHGQELNCTITVNADKIPGSNKQIFNTLENSLNEFVNQKRWTNHNYKVQEKINAQKVKGAKVQTDKDW